MGKKKPVRPNVGMEEWFKKIRPAVLQRDNFVCQIRDRKVCIGFDGRQLPASKLHVDHIIPKVNGGTDALGNLQTACRSCNTSKGSFERTRVKPSRDWLGESKPSRSNVNSPSRNWLGDSE